MKTLAVSLLVLVSVSFAFGLPDVPDVPETDLPDIEIPGLDILDGINAQLEELIAATDSLEWLIPELSALEDVSAKLEEIRETDPDIIGLQENIDALRVELVSARAEIAEVTEGLTGDIEEMRTSLDEFRSGLPLPSE